MLTYWAPNAQATAQVDTLTIGGTPVAGNTITATINGKNITYTLVSGDTTATAAAGLQALLAATATVPPEFNEVTWTVSGSVVTATSALAGRPFTLGGSATGGGATVTHALVTANSGPSDVGLGSNWNRGGASGLPQNGDDVVVNDSSVPMLWNLAALASIQFKTYQRWQSMTGNIGLPENNPAGYVEYRPTYFQFVGPVAATLPMTLGMGSTGSGPGRERYNLGNQQFTLNVLAAGGALDDYAVRILGGNANNVIRVQGTSVGVAMLSGETSTLSAATVDGGGLLALGIGVSFSAGTLTCRNGSLVLNCAPAAVVAESGSQVIVGESLSSTGVALVFAAVTARSGSRVSWLSSATITTLVLETGSVLDKAQDVRAMQITNSAIDGDTCQVLDPNNAITWTNATTVNNGVFAGPFTFAPGRTVKIT